MTRINVTVDGVEYHDEVEPRTLLVHYLREQLGKTGTVVGCDTSNCGACTVHLDGRSVKSCTVLAVQADGTRSPPSRVWPRTASCTRCSRPSTRTTRCSAATARPGMIMQSIDLLQRQPGPDRAGDPRRASRATSAAAPATRTSSRPCSGRRAVDEGASARDDDAPSDRRRRPRVGTARPPQGGRAADHRPDPLDRQHHAARDAAPGDGAQPVRARADHVDRHQPAPRPRRASSPSHRRRLAEDAGRLPCAWPITADQVAPEHPPMAVDEVSFAGEIVALVVAPGPRPARATPLELVDVDYEPLPAVARPRGGRARTRSWSTPTWAPTCQRPGSSTRPRRAPAATSTTRSPTPARRSSSSASTASSG